MATKEITNELLHKRIDVNQANIIEGKRARRKKQLMINL